jgi:hypothetical protein
MESRRPILILGVAAATAGIGFFAINAYRSFATPPPRPVTTFIDEDGSEALEASEQFLSPVTDQDRLDIPARLAEAAQAASPDPRDDMLRAVFRERLEIALNPDFDRYVDHIASLTGRTTSAIRAELGEPFQARWETSTNSLRNASYALDGCEIIPGKRDLVGDGGAAARRTDPGVYGSAALLADENAELRTVRVPVMFSMSMNGVGQTYLLFYTTAFVWNNERSVWVPFAAGYHDPAGMEERLPAPWI